MVATVIVTLISLVMLGITVADSNTRKIGYSDSSPIISIENTDTSTEILVFDTRFELSSDTVSKIDFACDVYKKSVPCNVKAASALFDIIKMTVGRFLA